jgi:hypothetical protein
MAHTTFSEKLQKSHNIQPTEQAIVVQFETLT